MSTDKSDSAELTKSVACLDCTGTGVDYDSLDGLCANCGGTGLVTRSVANRG